MGELKTILQPHSEIFSENLALGMFTADLWQVYVGNAAKQYQDYSLFFEKTFITKNLEQLLRYVENRIKGRSEDAVLQLLSPFGGGKTHALIAVYHKALKDWKTKVIIFVGTEVDPQEVTLWGYLEKIITGRVSELKDKTAPGKEKLRKVLEQAVKDTDRNGFLLLIDELLEYVVKAAGVRVENSDLAAQTLAFMHELTEVISTIPKACMILTLPTDVAEHYDENAAIFYQKLRKVIGRTETVFTTVKEDEIPAIIRKRLFKHVDEAGVQELVAKIVTFFEEEDILPPNMSAAEYQRQFTKTFPFLPEIYQLFYYNWGRMSEFQRIRSMLRILSMLLRDVWKKECLYISLSDIDLKNGEVGPELLKYLEKHLFESVNVDLLNDNARIHLVSASLPEYYQKKQLALRVATAILLYSVPAAIEERGVSRLLLKRVTALYGHSTLLIDDIVYKLKESLFYLYEVKDRLYFDTTPNFNYILYNKMESIDDQELTSLEKKILKKLLVRKYFKIYIWPTSTKVIKDDDELKLIIFEEKNEDFLRNIIENKGQRPRIHRNTLLFLQPAESKKKLYDDLRKKIAYEYFLKNNENLKAQMLQQIKERLKTLENVLELRVQECYREILVPEKEKLEVLELPYPYLHKKATFTEKIYEFLREYGYIVDMLPAIIIKERYLQQNEYLITPHLYETFLNVIGEFRLVNKDVLINALTQGVENGIFALGKIVNDVIHCDAWKTAPKITLKDHEIIISPELCKKLSAKSFQEEIEKEKTRKTPIKERSDLSTTNKLELTFPLPKGHSTQIAAILRYLETKFEKITITIRAEDGEISKSEFEDKIKEALLQLGISVQDIDRKPKKRKTSK